MEVKFPSKERVERDGVLVYAEGDELLNDPDEMARQGYSAEDVEAAAPVRAPERVERDGVLVYAEGDVIDPNDEETISTLGGKARKAGANKAQKPDADK